MTLKKSEIEVLASRYATALYSAAEEAKSLKEVGKQIEEFNSIASEDENFGELLTSPLFSKESLSESFKAISKKNKLNQLVENLFLVLVENRRLEIFSNICEKYAEIAREKDSIVKAEVISAKKLKAAEIKKVSESISQSTGKKVECENIIDASIIGGLKIKIGSKLIDNSVSGRLERLKISLAS